MIDVVAAILEVVLILVLVLPAGAKRASDALSVAIVPVIGSVGLVTLLGIASMVPAGHH